MIVSSSFAGLWLLAWRLLTARAWGAWRPEQLYNCSPLTQTPEWPLGDNRSTSSSPSSRLGALRAKEISPPLPWYQPKQISAHAGASSRVATSCGVVTKPGCLPDAWTLSGEGFTEGLTEGCNEGFSEGPSDQRRKKAPGPGGKQLTGNRRR